MGRSFIDGGSEIPVGDSNEFVRSRQSRAFVKHKGLMVLRDPLAAFYAFG